MGIGRRWVQAKMGRGRRETGLAAGRFGQARDRLGLLGDGRTELFGSTLGLGRGSVGRRRPAPLGECPGARRARSPSHPAASAGFCARLVAGRTGAALRRSCLSVMMLLSVSASLTTPASVSRNTSERPGFGGDFSWGRFLIAIRYATI